MTLADAGMACAKAPTDLDSLRGREDFKKLLAKFGAGPKKE